MGAVVDRLVAPCDATFLTNPMQCGDDDEEEMPDVYGDYDETVDQMNDRMSAIRRRAPAVYSKKHALSSTNDADAAFTLIAFDQLRPVVYLLSAACFVYTLKTWNYLSFIRYYLEDPKAVLITNGDKVIYMGALMTGWISLGLVVIVFVAVNGFLKESEPALSDADAKGQYLGSGIEGLLRMFHTRNTSAQLSIEDIEKTYLDRQTAAQHAKEKLNYYTLQHKTNPYFRLSRTEEEEVRELQSIVYDYDSGDFRITSRRTRLMQAITFVFWLSDIFMFVIDASVFVNATWEPLAGGINVYMGISLIVGVATAILPPWLLYQKYILRLIKKQLL